MHDVDEEWRWKRVIACCERKMKSIILCLNKSGRLVFLNSMFNHQLHFLRFVYRLFFQFIKSIRKRHFLLTHFVEHSSDIFGVGCLRQINETELVPHFDEKRGEAGRVWAEFVAFPVPRDYVMIHRPKWLGQKEHADAVWWHSEIVSKSSEFSIST